MATRAKSEFLGHAKYAEGPRVDAGDGKPPPRPASYFSDLLIGIIDGLTSDFNGDCKGGLAETVRSAFTVWDNLGIYDPRKLSKFTMATNTLTEATNIVYAYCDTSQLVSQFSSLADYTNWEQYIVLASRIGGVFIKDWKKYRGCMSSGKERGNGFDVGLCGAKLASVFLDTSL